MRSRPIPPQEIVASKTLMSGLLRKVRSTLALPEADSVPSSRTHLIDFAHRCGCRMSNVFVQKEKTTLDRID